MSARAKLPTPKPWPMKWVVFTIALFVVGYTVVNLYYRKKGPAFKPYEDMNKRATTARLLQAGWQKLPVEITRPLEKPGISLTASTARAGLGLGAELDASFAEKPVLLASIDRVSAPESVVRGTVYPIHFTASLADQRLQLGRVEALLRDQEIVLVPTLEKLPGNNLLSRWKDADYCALMPTDRLPPGRYTVRLAANGPALQWTMLVR
ncbi:MAG: hypothetical protein C0518_10090 [Opitutus sp.]|nr:hypothetical protein [Opitutus sp.]